MLRSASPTYRTIVHVRSHRQDRNSHPHVPVASFSMGVALEGDISGCSGGLGVLEVHTLPSAADIRVQQGGWSPGCRGLTLAGIQSIRRVGRWGAAEG